jgi:hypothetical protein
MLSKNECLRFRLGQVHAHPAITELTAWEFDIKKVTGV